MSEFAMPLKVIQKQADRIAELEADVRTLRLQCDNISKSWAAETVRAETALAERDAALAQAYQRAAKVAGSFSTSQHVAHSIREGVFPEQTDIRCAIEDEILALADNDPLAEVGNLEPSSTPETSAELEERICTCGAGHGSLEGHMEWCDWSAYLELPQPGPNDELFQLKMEQQRLDPKPKEPVP